MSFPGTYSAIRAMIRRTVLHTRVARGVARKAGLLRAPATLARPTTIIDAYIDPLSEGLAYQWLVDLTDVSRIHLASSSDITIYLAYNISEGSTGSTSLNIDGWASLPGLLDGSLSPIGALRADSANPLKWFELQDTERVPMRLGFAVNLQGEPGWPSDAFDGSFSVAVQVSPEAAL